MKSIIRQLRLNLFIIIIGIGLKVLPKDATKTLVWLTQLPKEE